MSVKINKETITAKGEELLKQMDDIVKRGIKEGNIRKVTLKNPNGEPIASLSLTALSISFGLTFLLAPILPILASAAALATDCTIEIEKISGK